MSINKHVFCLQPQCLHVLYEHASGYALFRVREFEEVSMLESEVQQSATDLSRFNSVVKLVAFSPFKSGTNALDNINSISEGKLYIYCLVMTSTCNMSENLVILLYYLTVPG